MSFEVTPRLEISDIEKLLKYLPEPTAVSVSYLSLSRDGAGEILPQQTTQRVQEIFPNLIGINLEKPFSSNYDVQNPTKEKVLAIVKERNRREICDEYPMMQLSGAKWQLSSENNSELKIELTETGIKIEYQGDEPNLVSEIRLAFGTEARSSTEVYIGNWNRN